MSENYEAAAICSSAGSSDTAPWIWYVIGSAYIFINKLAIVRHNNLFALDGIDLQLCGAIYLQ